MKPTRPVPPVDPWLRLLGLCPRVEPEPPTLAAPPDFAARVVSRWLRPWPAPPVAEPAVDLWERLGLRAAYAAGAIACVATVISYAALRDLTPSMDASAFDPALALVSADF